MSDKTPIGFNEFLGAVQHALLKMGLDAPRWEDNSIRDQGDYEAALESCTKTMAKLLRELTTAKAEIERLERELALAKSSQSLTSLR